VLGEVDADDMEGGTVDVDERRGLARACVLALAELDDEPLAMSSATRSETVTRVSPVSRATSARLCAPVE